ncbi:hypothetical protein K449DRAFT_440460 [Hypoxylon sp. EC38]|nr:hypothetical protein K449DRAFT_440460 [Hypoxylon sp. EC38]
MAVLTCEAVLFVYTSLGTNIKNLNDIGFTPYRCKWPIMWMRNVPSKVTIGTVKAMIGEEVPVQGHTNTPLPKRLFKDPPDPLGSPFAKSAPWMDRGPTHAAWDPVVGIMFPPPDFGSIAT